MKARRIRDFIRRRSARGTAGFLLLEALVAVGVMAFVLSVLPASVVISRQTVQRSADAVGARLAAEAVLKNEFVGPIYVVGTSTGTLDGYEWASLVRPNVQLQEAYKGRGWTPYDLIVSVRTPGGSTVTVETLRLGRAR